MKHLLITYSFISLFISCTMKEDRSGMNAEFKRYWYNDEAEITSYHLKQARYGEMHHGEAVLIFVTEHFSATDHVKSENGAEADDVVPVMKMNFVKKFTTGIYPYSMMTSAFAPVHATEAPMALKITTSSQEWCGHTFTQINAGDEEYDVQQFSYFGSEGDKAFSVPLAYPEDELWLRIRLDPALLPTGEIKVIPGTMSQRLTHQALKPLTATATLKSQEDISTYTLEYNSPYRILSIDFKTVFPHEIVGWSETYESGFDDQAKILTTEAIRNETIKSDYWRRNTPEDSIWRKKLGL